MSTYETAAGVQPARIQTVARARKQWRRQGIDVMSGQDNNFFRDDAPEVVQRPASTTGSLEGDLAGDQASLERRGLREPD